MKLYVKNMVCSRCKMVVRSGLEHLGFKPLQVELGEVELAEDISESDKKKIGEHLAGFGFELINDKKSRIIEKVKNLIIGIVQNATGELKYNLSVIIAEELNQDYSSISNLFSQIEGTTIEQFYILQKIEKAKELLMYDELSLGEIAFRLNYSSVAHLSGQFKKITGLTPSYFKQLKVNIRKPIEDV